MASSTAAASRSDQELAVLLAAIGEADSVELKLTVPLADRSRAGDTEPNVETPSDEREAP